MRWDFPRKVKLVVSYAYGAETHLQMAGLPDSGIFSTCRCLDYNADYKVLLQQNYTYLESKLDSKSGLVSKMFEKKVISFGEKRYLEKIIDMFERNREIIDLFLDKKTQNEYVLFLKCLEANGQRHIVQTLESGCTCNFGSSKSLCELPTKSMNSDFDQVQKIILEDKLAVIGICWMNGLIYCICHMDPHLFIYLAMPPFFRLNYQEFDLPVVKGQFHFYDMICCQKENVLIISDKANQCLWIVDVSTKVISQVQMAEGQPLRMSISRYSNHCSDDEGYEDIYGENFFGKGSSQNHDSKDFENNNCTISDENSVLYTSELMQKLLKKRLSDLDEKYCDSLSSFKESNKETILLVVKACGQYCLKFYTNSSRPKFLKKISLLIAEHYVISNAIQKLNDGHIFVCYSETDFGEQSISPWHLGEYLSNGNMIRSYSAPSGIWIPRYIAFDDSNVHIIYAISRILNEVVKLKYNNHTLTISPITVARGEFYMPSRFSFFSCKNDEGKDEEFFLVGQGEIKKPKPPASIVILKRLS